MTAGPTPVPPRVLLANARPVLYHRAPAFFEQMQEALDNLKWVFQTSQPVLILSGSGTAGMEAAITNFHSPGDRVLVLRGGRFGDRWNNICRAFGLDVVEVSCEWGHALDPQQVKAALDADPSIRAVYATASESSTGVAHPVREIAALCKGRDAICVVDAVSALAAFDVPMDAWGIDVLVAGSQKALMCPPGLACVGVSEKAWAFTQRAKLPRFYLDLNKERTNQDKSQSSWTPAVTLIAGLVEALRMIKEEGLPQVFARHLMLATATREACRALGCTLFAKESPSQAVTAVDVPAGVDGSEFVKILRTRYGITIAGGQEHLKGKIFRIAHLGYYDRFDILTTVGGVEMTLADLGYKFERGAGLAVASKILQVQP